ncbi:AraC-like ligand-binding domain-containing protein [Streptomyces filamentosus]|uniref:AraC-like ligand-binding domain-containing protein n=1 Tax=Streptomyces filamentosus TaxID=67294 RepID=UPI0037CEBECA
MDVGSLPREERTAAWMETADLALVTTRFRFPEPEHFNARISAMELGAVQLSRISYAPLQSYRSSKLIKQSDPELYQIALITSGKQAIEQGENSTLLEPGQFVLYDSSRPFEAAAGIDGEYASSLLLQFPRKILPLPGNRIAPLCGKALSVSSGMSHVFGQTLRAIAGSENEFTEADRLRLGSTVIDLAATAIAGHLDRDVALSGNSHAALLYRQILGFIGENLQDPDLGPGNIAAAHSISTRTLHRVFRMHEATVSDTIRRERMSRCRRDLADPALDHLPVSVIGARWGYLRPSDFTRAFRAASGTTPTSYRAGVRTNSG